MRQPYQVLGFPFIKERDQYHYAIFQRRDSHIWQGIAGGGEEGEKPIDTIKREAYEEASISQHFKFIRLSSLCAIPAANIHGLKWGHIIIVSEIQ